MSIPALKRNFSGGEVSPDLESRDDYVKYASACRTMRNFIPMAHGAARFRSGFKYVGGYSVIGDAGILIPFVFNSDIEDTYVLLFTDLKIYFIQNGGFVQSGGSDYYIVSPFAGEDVFGICYAQLGDIVYLTHPGYAPQRLARTGHTSWAIGDVEFGSTVSAPTGCSAAWYGVAGTAEISYKVVIYSNSGEPGIASAEIVCSSVKAANDWISGEYIIVTIPCVKATALAEDWGSIAIYKAEGGIWGLAGWIDLPDYSGYGSTWNETWRDENYSPDTTDGLPDPQDPFDGVNPAVCAIHQQRLVLGGGADTPRTFHGSQVGFYQNFNKSRPLKADDAYVHSLASGSVDDIVWITALTDMLIGTSGAEHRIIGDSSSGDAITYSAGSKTQSYWGSAKLRPIIVGTSVLHVQRQQSRVRDLFYSLEVDGYVGNDLTLLANHLFDGRAIVSWAWQQEPDNILWCVLDDGSLLGMTYLKEHQIWGWHRHETEGEFISVCTLPENNVDALYALIWRGGGRFFVERLSEKYRSADDIETAFFVDSGIYYNGWNDDTDDSVEISDGDTYESGDTVLITATGFTFSAGDVGKHMGFKGADGLKAEAEITVYAATNAVFAKVIKDIPDSLIETSTVDWSWMVNSVSGLLHINGFSVSVLADGSPILDQGPVPGTGILTLPVYASYILVGLPYTGTLEPLPFEAGEGQTVQGRSRTFGEITLRLTDTVGGRVGTTRNDTSTDPIKTLVSAYGTPVAPFTGDYKATPAQGYKGDLTVRVEQDQPLPLTVRAIVVDINFGGQ